MDFILPVVKNQQKEGDDIISLLSKIDATDTTP